MRAESERAFQNGGLAQVTQGPSEEFFEEEPAITADQLVGRATNPGAGISLTDMILQNKQDAIERLRQGRSRITERRDAQAKEDERNKWLALAQAMLSPTRTGAFGESLGTAAGALREESQIRSQHAAAFDAELDENANAEIAAESEAIDFMLEQSGQSANAAKGIHGSIETMVHPEDVDKDPASQRLVFGTMQLDDDGEWRMTMVEDADGEAFIAADRMEPARAAALIRATERASAQTGRSEEFITNAYMYKDPLSNIRRANQLLEAVDPTTLTTSGVQDLKNRLANFLGVDFGDTTELTELQQLIADDYLQKLTALKGQTSDRELAEMKGISASLGTDTEANYRALKRMEGIYQSGVIRGVRESWQSGDKDAVADLWEAANGNVWDRNAVPIARTREAYLALPIGQAFFASDDWGGQIMYREPAPEDEQ